MPALRRLLGRPAVDIWRGTTLKTDWNVGSAITWDHHEVTIADPAQVVLESEPYRRLSYTWHTFTPEWAKVHGFSDEFLTKVASEPRSKVTFDIEPFCELMVAPRQSCVAGATTMTRCPPMGHPCPMGQVEIQGPRLLLRALRADEIDAEWQAMVDADPMAIAELPDEARFRARLQRSGQMHDGWLDLAIDLGGESIGRIQTFVPPGRPLAPGVFEVGIGLREHTRGKGYGREALALLTDWLFEHAAAGRVEAPTDPANVAMRTVFQRVGWELVGTLNEAGRDWVMYAITRQQWAARNGDGGPGN
jgi:RimJ/RimL family protein N-acetyltransferase